MTLTWTFFSLQEQILTDEIKELHQKVARDFVLLHPIFNNQPENSDHLQLMPLQGNLIQQENEQLYKKIDIIRKENAELKNKVFEQETYIF